MRFTLRFPEADIARWTQRFPIGPEALIEEVLVPRVRERGCLTKPEFVELCRWKSPRSQPLVRQNASDLIEAVTRAAFESRHEHVKINVLRTLKGVSWPTASVILHFCDEQPYPILDVRALWSLGCAKPPAYTIDVWLAYTACTREIARRTGLSMRAVDRALWQYSVERQRS